MFSLSEEGKKEGLEHLKHMIKICRNTRTYFLEQVTNFLDGNTENITRNTAIS